jgi:hypothetical protein
VRGLYETDKTQQKWTPLFCKQKRNAQREHCRQGRPVRTRDRVVVGFPHAGTVDTDFAFSLATLMRERRDRVSDLVCVQGLGLLSRTRNVIVRQFLNDSDAAWLLMVDSDQRLPLAAFDKLTQAAHDTERPVVAGLVFAAFFDNAENLRPVPALFVYNAQGEYVPCDDYQADAVIKVDGIGTGCVLIHRTILERMRAEASPQQGADWAWFWDGPVGGSWVSEDLLFSKRLQAMGVPIHAHTGAVLAHHKQIWLTDHHHTNWKAGQA